MVNINIFLNDSNSGIYLAGQVLHGTAEITLESDKKINEFFVVIQGIAKCEWTETESHTVGHGDNRRTENRTVYYGAKDTLIYAKVTLFPNGIMPAGVHSFNFECILPPQLTASYEARYGSIRYEVDAKLDIPWRFDKEIKCQFTVARVEDLNLNQQAMFAVKNEEIKHFCCFPCRSDPCIITLTLPYSGYVPGQILDYHLEYHNKSSVSMLETRVVLRRVTTYTSDYPHHKNKYEHEDLIRLDLGRLKAEKNVTSYDGRIEVPRILVPTNTHCSRVMQVSYELKIEVVSEGCHGNVTIHTPIIIGSIPIATAAELQQPQYAHNPMHANMPVVAEMHPQNFGGHLNGGGYNGGQFNGFVPELPPPSFDEAQKIHEKKKLDETDNNQIGWTVPNSGPSAPSAPALP